METKLVLCIIQKLLYEAKGRHSSFDKHKSIEIIILDIYLSLMNFPYYIYTCQRNILSLSSEQRRCLKFIFVCHLLLYDIQKHKNFKIDKDGILFKHIDPLLANEIIAFPKGSLKNLINDVEVLYLKT